MTAPAARWFWPATATLGWLLAMWFQASGPSFAAQMATADRIQEPGWWPTKGTASREDYVGPAVCATCHAARAASQETTGMALTARPAAESDILRAHDRLSFRSGGYVYEVESGDAQSTYTVSGGAQSVSISLAWAFGMGKIGQTYIFERDGTHYESRVSYYDALQGLDFTPARALEAPRDVEEAIGRPLEDAEARRCFGCHMTASTTAAGFDLAAAIPGVTCEACHGPGRAHVAAMTRSGPRADGDSIMDPGTLDPVDSVDFCGACHGTFWDVTLAGEEGTAPLRSQPYRLQSSRCWNGGDERITCVSCHDPHRPLVRDSPAYDPQCLSCHVSAGSEPTPAHPGGACPIAARNCASCHMPKYDVPEMHFQFTDHLIRIVRSVRPPLGSDPGCNRTQIFVATERRPALR